MSIKFKVKCKSSNFVIYVTIYLHMLHKDLLRLIKKLMNKNKNFKNEIS